MSKYDKYVFRLYTLGKPNEKTKEFFQDKYKGDDAYFMNSPYMSGKHRQYEINKYKRLGEIQKEPVRRGRLRPDFLSRSYTPNNGLYSGGGSLLLPHRGISVIGLAEPQYSIYEPRNIFDRPFNLSDKGVTYNTKLEHALNDRQSAFIAWYYHLANNMPSFQEKLNKAMKVTGHKLGDTTEDVLFPKTDFTDDELNELYNTGNKLFNDWKSRYQNDIISDTDYDFGYKPSYYNLLRAIDRTLDSSGANSLVVASIPESALYTSKDVLSNDNAIRAMRDFPEELVVNRLKPIKAYAGNQRPYPDAADFFDEDGFDEDLFDEEKSNYYNSLTFNDDSDIVEDLPADYTGPQIAGFLDWYRNKPFEEREKRAKHFINTLFNIDPDYIPSDATKKYIYKDLSSWYNKNNTNKNIINGLTQGGRQWQ